MIMKLLSLISVLLFTIQHLQAQLPVSQTAENKNVVLEEFTGIHCGYCPDGHKRAQQIYDAHPDDVVLINIHTGSYASPGAGEPDFRTSFGSAIASQSQLAGYPAGTVNRHYFGYSQNNSPSGATALGRGDWANAANTILGQSSYCNVALEATVDTQTKVMTIDVEVYYTADSPQSSNFINVALLQNNVEGPQSGSSANPNQVLPNGNYNHMHMLRHLITGQWGDEITTTTQGTLVQRQYSYTLPNDINGVNLDFGNLEIAAFVAEGHQEIITGSLGTISYTGLSYNTNAEAVQASGNTDICNADDLNPSVTVYNNGTNVITDITFEYSINNGATQTYSWTGNINSLGTKTIELPASNFTVNASNTLDVTITSVNGAADENAGDNTTSYTFNGTSNHGVGTDYVVTIVQDRYGDETTWGIMDSSGSVVANGGPYSQLASNTTQAHTHNVTLSNADCYKFVILDSYGDGINGGYGNGSYKMEQSDGTLVFQGNGVFSSEDSKSFTTSLSGTIDEMLSNKINIYPNPGNGIITVSGAKDTHISVYNAVGNLLFEKEINNEIEQISINNLSNGIYFIKFNKNHKTAVKKLIVK